MIIYCRYCCVGRVHHLVSLFCDRWQKNGDARFLACMGFITTKCQGKYKYKQSYGHDFGRFCATSRNHPLHLSVIDPSLTSASSNTTPLFYGTTIYYFYFFYQSLRRQTKQSIIPTSLPTFSNPYNTK